MPTLPARLPWALVAGLAAAPLALAAPPAAMPPLVEHLLPWTAERESLTVAYLQAHRTAPLSGDPVADTQMNPRAIVLHWTAGPTAKSAWSTFASARLAGRADLADAGALNVGAHFLVDRDGTIERLAPDTRVLRHCIGLNHLAIRSPGWSWGATLSQVQALPSR